MTTVAIIPARGSSKRLPRKNLRLLGGHPLIVYSIRAALAAKCVESVFVSTEDDEIAEVALRYGAQVIRRPQELAIDEVGNADVVRHAIESIQGLRRFQSIAVLQPTSPFRSADDVDFSLELLVRSDVKSVMTITTVEHHPAKCVTLDHGIVSPYTTRGDMEAQTQTLPTVYRQNGAVYTIGVFDFLRFQRLCVEPCAAYIMPAERSLDIDTELDFRFAECLLAGATG